MRNLRVLFIDLETTPNLMAGFDLWQKYYDPSCILKERSLISVSWCWEHDLKMRHASLLDCRTRLEKDVYDDYHVVKVVHELISQADVVVAHNGRKFDMKMFRTRALINGFPPIPEPIILDTFEECKRYFKFNSNRLDYVGQVLGHGKKLKTGQELWNRIVFPKSKRDRDDAIRQMVTYNDRDTELLVDVYHTMLPWMQVGKVFNHVLDEHDDCPHCRKSSTLRHSPSWTVCTKAYWYKRYRCTSCKGWATGKKNIGGRV